MLDRGKRNVGPGVIEAFYAGLESLFRSMTSTMSANWTSTWICPRGTSSVSWSAWRAIRKLGTTSGKPYFVAPRGGSLVAEVCGDEMSVGITVSTGCSVSVRSAGSSVR